MQWYGTAQATSNTAGVRRLGSVQSQIDSSLVLDKTGTAVTKDDIDNITIQCSLAGGKPTIIMCHPMLAVQLSKIFEGFIDRDVGNSREYSSVVDLYTNGVGHFEIVQNDLVKFDKDTNVGDILILDPTMWEVAVYRNFRTYDLAKTGDNDSKQILIEAGLKNKNQFSSCMITNVLAGTAPSA